MEAQEERSVRSAVAHSQRTLTGLRVIELADEQAEYCRLALAGLGADVIKVEPPGGSSTRRIIAEQSTVPQGGQFVPGTAPETVQHIHPYVYGESLRMSSHEIKVLAKEVVI